MVKKIFLCFAISFLLITTVSALDTEITVKTLPFHEVQLTTSNPSTSTFSPFESFKEDSDEYGDVSFVFSSNEETFNIIIYVKKDGENIFSKPTQYFDVPAGEPLYYEILPSGVEPIPTPVPVNETNSSEANLTINESEPNLSVEEIVGETNQTKSNFSSMTGFVTSKVKEIPIKYLLVGVLFLGGALIFLVYNKKLRKKFMEKGDKKVERSSLEDELRDAEKKIEEAQEEIKKIRETGKRQERIKEAKKKLIEDEKELMRLRGES
ncbi:MAG: hypothetical protein KKF68_03860 [Nanoarchaeota archaeon]|nr:hypothetical protein [Nanoarchaeota archaeon]